VWTKEKEMLVTGKRGPGKSVSLRTVGRGGGTRFRHEGEPVKGDDRVLFKRTEGESVGEERGKGSNQSGTRNSEKKKKKKKKRKNGLSEPFAVSEGFFRRATAAGKKPLVVVLAVQRRNR